MWAFHDSNQDLLRNLRKKNESKQFSLIENDVQILIGESQRLILVEEMRLLPYSFELLKENDWREMSIGEEEIGWAFNIRPEAMNSKTKILRTLTS